MRKIPIRLQLTAISVLLLTFCCIGLTVILNLSANHMADVIEAPIKPTPQINSCAPEPSDPFPSPITPPSTIDADNGRKARNAFLYKSIIYMVLVIIFGSVLIYYLIGKALKPLQELRRQMKIRTVYKPCDELLIPEGHDEIADITMSLNEISSNIDEAFAMQKRFSQNVANELYTPLAVLKNKVDVFRKKNFHTPREYERLMDVITSQTNKLSEFIQNLLNLTNMDELDCNGSVELTGLLTDVVQDIAPLAIKNRVVLTVHGKETLATGNRSLLYRAFYNLIENAIKYNNDDGTVNIYIEKTAEHTSVAIVDTGIGIPTEMQQLIFEPFFRVNKARSIKMGGAGLGLSTVKAIIKKHSGTVEVTANSDGGTSFKVCLQ